MSEPGFKEVTKEEFKEVYFRLGDGKASGWTVAYRRQLFKSNAASPRGLTRA